MGPRDLERLSSELVRLCDSVEKHGLVDYQMGVAEEDIMDCKLYSHDLQLICSDHTSSTVTMPCTTESRAREKRRSRSSNGVVCSGCIKRTITLGIMENA